MPLVGGLRYHEGCMNRTPKTIAAVLAGCAGIVLLIAAAKFWLRPPAPLTATEKRLVGNWNQIALPGEQPLTGMTFGEDRSFRSHDGQFAGRWWITAGQLHVKIWRDDWREDWSFWRVADQWRALRGDSGNCDMRFDGNGDRVELARPGETADCALIRRNE